MIPAEQIDGIRVLNANGLGGSGGPALTNGQSNGHQSDGSFGGLGTSSVLNIVLNAGMLIPVIREVMRGMQGTDEADELMRALRKLPGGERLAGALSEDRAGEAESDLDEAPPAERDGDAGAPSSGDGVAAGVDRSGDVA